MAQVVGPRRLRSDEVSQYSDYGGADCEDQEDATGADDNADREDDDDVEDDGRSCDGACACRAAGRVVSFSYGPPTLSELFREKVAR
jgi:hypothetical protein